MSTRGMIAVEGSSILIYKHCDGYPDGVIPWLTPFVKDFFKIRGWDPEYLPARILMYIGVIDEKNRKRYRRELKRMDSPDTYKRYAKPDMLGYGVTICLYSDIEWFYFVRKDGTVEVYDVCECLSGSFDGSTVPYGCKLNSSIPLKKKRGRKPKISTSLLPPIGDLKTINA